MSSRDSILVHASTVRYGYQLLHVYKSHLRSHYLRRRASSKSDKGYKIRVSNLSQATLELTEWPHSMAILIHASREVLVCARVHSCCRLQTACCKLHASMNGTMELHSFNISCVQWTARCVELWIDLKCTSVFNKHTYIFILCKKTYRDITF